MTTLEGQFDDALAAWDAEERNADVGTKAHRAARRVRRALYAAMWFIENGTGTDGTSDVFFRVRELSREALA